MKENNKNKLLAVTCVFSFVAFCFAIANTFGNTYAASGDICPSDWEIDGQWCTKKFDDSTQCLAAFTNLGMVGTISPNSYAEDKACVYGSASMTETYYTAYIKQGTFYTVTYSLAGGTMSNTTVQRESGTELTLPKPSKTGYTFKHWIYTNSSGTSSVTVNAGEEITVNSNMTLTAIWEENNSDDGDENTGNDNTGDGTTTTTQTFEATFNANGGTISGDTTLTCTTVAGGNSCIISDLPTASKEGHVFEGWGTSASCTSGENSLTLTENDTYYACFTEEEPNEYTVKFNTNGGTLYRNSNKTSKLSYTLNSLDYSDYTALKDGYTFKGWRKSTETESACSKTKVISELTGNLSLIACYEVDDSGINENPNTGSTLLYIAFLTGILALVYTCYYSYKVVKVRNK